MLTSGAMAKEITPAVRSELAPTGKLRIGLNHGNFLLVTPGSSATEPRGVASDIGRELARRVGVPVEFIKFESAGKLGDSVRTGVWDVAFLGAEPQRAAEIAFTGAYLEIPSTYIVPAGSPIRSVDEVDREGVRIAVTEQSAYGLYLVRSVKRAKSGPSARPEQNARSLSSVKSVPRPSSRTSSPTGTGPYRPSFRSAQPKEHWCF